MAGDGRATMSCWRSVTMAGDGRRDAQPHFRAILHTKQHGKGTGLGLATVYGIVQQNQGVIHVHSEPQVGTTFKSTRTAKSATTKRCRRSTHCLRRGDYRASSGGRGRCPGYGRRILEGFGYTVLEAGGPAAALECTGAYAGAIDLLVTDVIMPGLNGRELVERVIALRANQVLYISGYPADFISDRAVLEDGVNFLQNPSRCAAWPSRYTRR